MGLADEYAGRVRAAQEGMRPLNLTTLIVTTPVEIRYFTGFASQLLEESPTRPCILVLPPLGERPIMVCPKILEHSVRQSGVESIRTWPSIETDCVEVLASVLTSFGGQCATPMGVESHIAMPLNSVLRLLERTGPWINASPLVHSLRVIKSSTEIAAVRKACVAASEALEAVSLVPGDTERSVARRVKIEALRRGVDSASFVVVVSGADGYSCIVNGPTDRALRLGDVMAIDIGCSVDGYWCDFNRNWAVGSASPSSRRYNALLWDATERGLAAVRPGATYGDVWSAMTDGLIADGCDPAYYATGRQGHGLGLTLTEQPSVCKGALDVLQPGMVLTLEPSLRVGSKQWVHEENIAVTETGYELLSFRAPRELPVLLGLSREPSSLD